MSYVKPSNVPPAQADVDPHSIKEKTYMRGIYEDYDAQQLELENGNQRPEEDVAVNLGAVLQGVVADKPVDEGEGDIEVMHEDEDRVLDKEQLEPPVDIPLLGLVAGEIAQELDEEEQKKDENPEDAALQAENIEDVPEDDRLDYLANVIHNPQLSEEQTVDKVGTGAEQSVKVLEVLPTETSEYQSPPTDTSLSEVPMDQTPATSTKTTNTSVTQHTVLGAPPIEGRPTGSQRMGFHRERTPDPENFFEIVAATRPVTRLAPVEPPVPPPMQEVLLLYL
ncbi:hypothetical protein BGX38DRAFT_455258 [Terfezia claveryi]|nr:hypothetical protein BGX38DRAFT_455258 [Terfezia claveryi]